MTRKKSETISASELLNGKQWVFLCFTRERLMKLKTMLCEAIVATNKGMHIGHIHFPTGVLWNGKGCEGFTVPKDELPWSLLSPGLWKHFGYEMPETTSDLFTLGVSPEDDAELDRVGLFRKSG